MLTLDQFHCVIRALGQQAQEDIAWAESLALPTTPAQFASEVIFVICNSGMKNTVARMIFDRCCVALQACTPVFEVFKHPGKAAAIEAIWRDRKPLLEALVAAPDKLAFCESLPWIGGITKYHLAKNFGLDVAKPDVHLQRLADLEGVTAQALCERLAAATGYRVATVDTLIWRACANGIINSRTGALAGAAL
jgi:hypothetical protein